MPSPQVQQDLLTQLARVRPRVKAEWRGNFCFVSLRRWWLGEVRVCRFQYLSGSETWRCAIYRPGRDVYGSDGFFFPAVGDPVELTQMCLVAHNLK